MARDGIAAELYSAPPGEFVALRDEAVRALRADGERKLAAEVAKWRKPVVAAWVVNLLAADRPDELERLVSLGSALVDAQRRGDGAALREVAAEKQRLVQSLVRDGRAFAAEAGQQVGVDVGHEVEATLNAAVADPAAAERVRSGRLLKPESYAGFGPAETMDRPHLTVVAEPPARKSEPAGRKPAGKAGRDDGRPARRLPGGGSKAAGTEVAPDSRAARKLTADRRSAGKRTADRGSAEDRAAERRAAALEKAEQAIGEAEADLAEANRARTEAVAEVDAAGRATGELQDRADELRAQLADVERRLVEAGLDQRRLSRAADRAAIELERARTRLESARRQADRHRP